MAKVIPQKGAFHFGSGCQCLPRSISLFRGNTTTIGGQSCSSIALDADGDFVVTWTG